MNKFEREGTGVEDQMKTRYREQDYLMESITEEARRRLREKGLRATPTRIVVYEVLKQESKPLSHAETTARVQEREQDRHWDPITIYRSLTDMSEAGIVRRIDFGDHVWRFDLEGSAPHSNQEKHPHFICTECGTVDCLPNHPVPAFADKALPRSLRSGNVELEYRGLCDHCNHAT